MSIPTCPGCTHNGMGTHWPAVLCIEVGAYMVCIWSLQNYYMHACIKSAYNRVNLSGHVLSHMSWTHAQWHGHTLACSVVHRGWCIHAMHLKLTDLLHARVHQICVYACEHKWACAFLRVLDARILTWAHTGLQCCVQSYAHMCASASVHLEPADLLHARMHQICVYACEFKWAHAFPHVLDACILAWAHTGLQCCVQRLCTHVCITSVHNTAGQCVPMPVCVCPGCVGRHVPT